MDTSAPLFATLSANILSIHGDRGKEWLRALPQVCDVLSQKWALEDLTPVENMSFNFVGRARQHTTPVVVKISCDPKTYNEEKAALRYFHGKGMVELLAHDDAYLALLLEGLTPGTSLKGMVQAEAEPIYAGVVRAMHDESGDLSGFRHIREWLTSLDRAASLPQDLVQHAVTLKNNLIETAVDETVLHGDLHADNIVKGATWKAIDPKGIVGELAFELAAFNYGCESGLPALLSVDADRYRQWVFVRCMLGAAWCAEDNMDPSQFLNWAQDSQAAL